MADEQQLLKHKGRAQRAKGSQGHGFLKEKAIPAGSCTLNLSFNPQGLRGY